MKLNKTLPFASFTLAAGFILTVGVGCSDDASPPAEGSGGTPAADSGGATATGGSTSGGSTSTTGGADGTGGAEELTGSSLLGVDGKFWPFRAANADETGSSKYWLTSSTEACPAEGHSIVETYTAKGDPAQEYTIHFEVRGALALRCIENGTPMGTTPDPAGMNEAFYVGGEPSGDSLNNTISITVSPDVATATANTYYLNGMPSDSGMCDEQITYDVKYQGSFVIMGDSTVTLSFNSPDCQALSNCGADAASCDPRQIDTDGIEVRASSPQPVSDVFFVDNDQFDLYPQWLIFDVQEITTP